MSAFRGMRFWVGLSVALHLAALLFLILDVLPRRIPEPEEIAIPVELIAPMPPQQAHTSPAPVKCTCSSSSWLKRSASGTSPCESVPARVRRTKRSSGWDRTCP
jgi:hypothetical protein